MVVALPVCHPRQPGRVLVQAGFALSDRIIRRLRDVGVRDVWVHFPDLAQVERYVNAGALQRRQQLATSIAAAFSSAQSHAFANLDYQSYADQIKGIINELIANPVAAIYLGEMLTSDHPLLDHCMRVSYLSVLLGLKLDSYLVRERARIHARRAKQVTNLGLGAALHDVGKLRLDPQVLADHLAGDDDPDGAWTEHVQLGFDLVRNRIAATATNIVLQHHQRYDGSGFPRRARADGERVGLAGDQVHVYARIVGLANEFDRLHYHRYSQRRPIVEAVGRLVDAEHIGWFDPRVVRAFLEVVPPFPPGAVLKLSDGSTATTVEHHADAPCRPTVRRLDAGDDDPNLDLRQDEQLTVIEAEGENVAALSFDLPDLAGAPA
jgi:HD-GYP domain-containing protein (c-di-GMP phosphodiesterase class II)